MSRIFNLSLCVLSFCAAINVGATPIAASNYSLSELSGVFAYGRTDWNAYGETGGRVNNSTDISRVQNLLSDGYTPLNSSQSGHYNGIYSGYPNANNTIEFEFNGGSDYILNSLTFLSSRSYSTSTTIALQYALNGGAWQTALNTTTGALGISTGSANDYTLNFGNVTADAFRLVLDGSQISFHELSIDGAAVPEPTTIALFGLGLMGFAASRRKFVNNKNT